MKHKMIYFGALLMLMTACSDSAQVRDVKGTYRYKTTGKVTLEENFAGATKADTLVANLDNESGTLEVVSLHNGDSLLLTFDPLNGDVSISHGIADGKRIRFAPYYRTLEVPTVVKYYDTISIGAGILIHDTVLVRERKEYEVYDIRVRGYADAYDNNLVFNLQYDGKSQSSLRTLRGEGIQSLAKRN
ncbi:MAG: hypothetical protein IJS82_02895 [Paludibacteraceae bacterium]|nr:hypothetical protein [Paludibacteraceae bacterium]